MEKRKKHWFLLSIAGMLPGTLLWILVYAAGFPGEYAGLLIGLGGIAALRWSGTKLKIPKLIAGIPFIVLFSALANHISYIMDVYNSVHSDYEMILSGTDKTGFGLSDASNMVMDNILRDNVDNMRQLYLQAFAAGLMLALLFFVALYFYYVTMDKLDKKTEA